MKWIWWWSCTRTILCSNVRTWCVHSLYINAFAYIECHSLIRNIQRLIVYLNKHDTHTTGQVHKRIFIYRSDSPSPSPHHVILSFFLFLLFLPIICCCCCCFFFALRQNSVYARCVYVINTFDFERNICYKDEQRSAYRIHGNGWWNKSKPDRPHTTHMEIVELLL